MNGTSLNVAGKAARAAAVGALVGLAAGELGLQDIVSFNLFAWLGAWAMLGAFVGWFSERVLGWVAVAAVLLVCLIAATPLAARLAARWVRDDKVHGPLDAVVVLSGGVQSDSLLGPAGTERLLTGIELLRASHAPRIVTTRARQTIGGVTVSTDAGQKQLLDLARVDSGWTVLDTVLTTRDEAVRSARLLLPSSRRIAVVTSPMHTRRACALFETAGFEVTCVAAREIDHVTRRPVDAEDRLAAWRAWLYERLGMIKYRWKGWIR